MSPSTRSLVSRLGLRLVACSLALSASLALAAYPDKPIKLMVPFPAGGTVDAVARAFGTQLAKEAGVTVIVDNVPGAGGAIATRKLVGSAADGYTILLTTPNHTINPSINENLGYDAQKDVTAVGLLAQIPELLVAPVSTPFNDFTGMVAYARAHPGKLNYASAGNGTLPHVTMELLLKKLGLDIVHVPYKGAAPALNDLLAGVVSLKYDTIATSAGHIQSGRIKALGIASLKRSALMPAVPTISEQGLPGYQGILWMGVLAPSGTPVTVVDALNTLLRKSLQDAELRKKFDAWGVDVVGSSPAEFSAVIETELKQWAGLIRRSTIK